MRKPEDTNDNVEPLVIDVFVMQVKGYTDYPFLNVSPPSATSLSYGRD